MRILLKLFGPAAILFLFNVYLTRAGIYFIHPMIDIPMHILGGALMAIIVLQVLKLKELWGRDLTESIPVPVMLVLVVGFALSVGVFWEWYEFLLDTFNVNFVLHYGFAQPSIADTMKDLFDDFLGAGFIAMTFLLARKK